MSISVGVPRFSLHQRQLTKAVIDPLEFFPYEVFSRIIQFACYDDYAGRAPLEFLAISSRWKMTILETPEAWSCITIDNSEEIVLRTQVFIHFSCNNSIDLRVARLEKSESIDALKLVLKEDKRIRSLSFRLRSSQSSSGSLEGVMFPGYTIFSQQGANITFPMLEDITLGSSTTIPRNLLSSCPKLQRISGGKITADDIPSISHSVREIEFSFLNGSELDALNDRTFTFLTLRNIGGMWPLHGSFPSQFLRNNLEHMEGFWIETWNLHRFLDEFLTITPPRLGYLRIQVSFDMIEYFFSSLYRFPQLNELSVHIVNSHWAEPNWPVRSPPPVMGKPLLRKVSIYDDTDRHNGNQLKDLMRCIEIYPVLQNCDDLFIMLRGSLVEFSMVTPLLQSIPTLRELCVRTEPFQGQKYLGVNEFRPQVVVLPCVELLIVDSVDYLRLIRAPNLKDLNIRKPTKNKDPFPINSILGNNLGKLKIDWESLEKLRRIEGEGDAKDARYILDEMANQLKITELSWRTWERPCESFTAALGSLTLITLPRREMDITSTQRDNPFNSLCFALLKGACPSLQTINSAMYPLWDLLFAALLFRCESQGIEPIITISLPQFPVSRILRCLVGLLKGRTETLEVGFDSLMEKYRGEPVCSLCLGAGYTHCLDMTAGMASDSYPIKSGVERLDSCTASTHKEAVYWEKILEQKRPGEIGTCNRHDFNHLTAINSFTPIGI